MYQKENNPQVTTQPSKNRKGVSSKATGEANDFVLKRYRLQQNKLFKQKHNEELRYDVEQRKNQQSEDEDIDDELVIVPLEHSRCEQLDNPAENEAEKEVEAPDIFVFDDDEDEDGNIQDVNEDILQNTHNYPFNYQESTLLSPTEHSHTLSAKPTLRDNWSAAQLITPKGREHLLAKEETVGGSILQRICESDKQAHSKKQMEEQGIQNLKGVKVSTSGKNLSVTITDKRLFSIQKLPSGIILKCIIKRTSSILSLMSPEFDLYLANGLKHIVSAKKYPLRNRELFRFSINPLKFQDESQIAVMHANVNHNIYWLLDRPRRMGDIDLSLIYLVIGYYKLKPQEKQRRFTTLLPPTSNSEYQLAMDYQLNSINFSNMKQQIRTEVSNVSQWKNQSTNSTKNFVLADEDDPDYRYLQMKKQSDDVFELTVQHPFSPLQAMAIAMTRFDVQLK